jgi:hypothetical protein
MFKHYLSIPHDMFKAFRELPVRAKRNFNREIRDVVQPNAQKQVDGLFTAPGPVKYKFRFGTAGNPAGADRSRRAFFASRGFGRGIPTRRTGAILKAWAIEITRQGQTTYILLTNTDPKAKFVYGLPPIQQQIIGHARTGWGKDNKVAFGLLQEYVIGELVKAWRKSVTDAVKGKS